MALRVSSGMLRMVNTNTVRVGSMPAMRAGAWSGVFARALRQKGVGRTLARGPSAGTTTRALALAGFVKVQMGSVTPTDSHGLAMPEWEKPHLRLVSQVENWNKNNKYKFTRHATRFQRLLAMLIDGITISLAGVIPGVGAFLALLLVIFRDCVTEKGSIGKYIMGLRITDRTTGDLVPLERRAKRGLIQFALNLTIIGTFVELFELMRANRRLGDFYIQDLQVSEECVVAA
eukprot:CAMPEP_0119125600 /NCGR_PEP_ID=MMETSP1310-20130426/4823_1 /TAXON_ID=464262 /ORGANISM="Genus nov. species nov., Strain RCC2339" /LENGTH=231 /DNA_ID=CAMNT_0007115683 /DNA_START=21 /DNA_END=713 /DNA_ORIENTATION=+